MPHAITDKTHLRGTGIQIPARLAKPLAKFARLSGKATGHPITKTEIACVGLAYVLPKLISGEFEIVNGAIQPLDRKARR